MLDTDFSHLEGNDHGVFHQSLGIYDTSHNGCHLVAHLRKDSLRFQMANSIEGMLQQVKNRQLLQDYVLRSTGTIRN